MISRERAVELVDAHLAERRLTMSREGQQPPESAVYAVEEYSVGWVTYWKTAEDRPTGDARVGNGSHLLVDRQDGSIHYVAEIWWEEEGWEDHYLWVTKGIRRPDPLAAVVRALARSAGLAPAMAHLRKQAPRMTLAQAKAYVTAVHDGAEPPEDLGALTRPDKTWWPIDTVAGPITPSDPAE